MRRLLLLRHAKAEPWDSRDDFDRELTERGQNDARHIGDLLVASDMLPDLIVYSSARRTRQTAEAVASRLPRAVESLEENALYEATRYLVLEVLRDLPDDARTILVVGHNTGVGDTANYLAGDGPKDQRQRMASKYPTSGLAVLEFELDSWANIEPHRARLRRFVSPADLGLRNS